MRLLLAAHRVAMPWRNGRGLTQVVATGDGWRVSIATIDRDAPFSRFDGYDRTLVLLDGAVTLGGAGWQRPLMPGDMATFAGEDEVAATITVPSLALNVMTLRGTCSHETTIASAPMAIDTEAMVIALDDATVVVGHSLARLDAVGGPARMAGSGRLLAIRFSPYSL